MQRTLDIPPRGDFFGEEAEPADDEASTAVAADFGFLDEPEDGDATALVLGAAALSSFCSVERSTASFLTTP